MSVVPQSLADYKRAERTRKRERHVGPLTREELLAALELRIHGISVSDN